VRQDDAWVRPALAVGVAVAVGESLELPKVALRGPTYTEQMGLLGVDTIGLRMLAAHCQSWAAEIETTNQPGSARLSCQATSAAVAAVHASVGAAAQSLAGRMSSTAAKLTAASVQYAVNDEDSAAQLSAVGIEV
jgi:hypothetical protein